MRTHRGYDCHSFRRTQRTCPSPKTRSSQASLLSSFEKIFTTHSRAPGETSPWYVIDWNSGSTASPARKAAPVVKIAEGGAADGPRWK